LMPWLTLWPWKWRQYIPLKHWRTPTWLHNVTSQKTVLVIVTANIKSSIEETASPPFKLMCRDSGIQKPKSEYTLQFIFPAPTDHWTATRKWTYALCAGPLKNPECHVVLTLILVPGLCCFWKGTWMWAFYGSAKNSGACPASAVIWVGFVCDLLVYGLVNSAGNPSLNSLTAQVKHHTLLSGCLGNLRQALKWLYLTTLRQQIHADWCHKLVWLCTCTEYHSVVAVPPSRVRATLVPLSVGYVWFQ
jgi:hypothetical protein